MSDPDLFKLLLEDLETARSSAERLREATEGYDKASKGLQGAEGALDKAALQLISFSNKIKPIIEQSSASLARVASTLEGIDAATLKQVSLQVRDELRGDIRQEVARLQAALNDVAGERLPRMVGPLILEPVRGLLGNALTRIDAVEDQQIRLAAAAQRIEEALSDQRQENESRLKLLQQQVTLNNSAMERRLAHRTNVALLTLLLFTAATSFCIIALLQPSLGIDVSNWIANGFGYLRLLLQ